MNTIVLYNFNIYLKNPSSMWSSEVTSSISMQWDVIISIIASNVEDAIKKMPEEYDDWKIVNVEYPLGWPNFPLFPPSTCTAGAVGVDALTGEHYLIKA